MTEAADREHAEESARILMGRRLVQLRGATRQSDFARGLGMHGNTLGRYERGERWPEGDLLFRLFSKGWSTNWLIGGEGPEQRTAREGGLTLSEPGAAYARGPGVLGSGAALTQALGEPSMRFARQLVDGLRVDARLLRERNLVASSLCAVIAEGDSMSPTIEHGDMLLIDCAERSAERAGIYVLASGDVLLARRIEPDTLTGGVLVLAANSAVPPRAVPRRQLAGLKIAGRVQLIWSMRPV